MEHTWARHVRPLLTPFRFRSLLRIVTGETTLAIDNVLDRPAADAKKGDPAEAAYLEFLARDISRGTSSLGRFRKTVVRRWQKLVADVKIDRENDRIDGDVGL